MNKTIVLITDNNFISYTLVAVYNVLKKRIGDYYINFKIVTCDVNQNIIIPFENEFDSFKIEIIKFDDSLLKNCLVNGHVSKATYVKYFIPNLVSDDVVLYLDGDILINDDISIVWDYFNPNSYVTAVWDPGHIYEYSNLGIPNGARLFNAGVMLINCKKMRNDNIVTMLIKYQNENYKIIKNADQSVFNSILYMNWSEMPISFNLQKIFFLKRSKFFKMKKKELIKYLKNPHIVHFTTHSKPWHLRSGHPYTRKYRENYYNIYGNIIYSDKSIKGHVKHLYEVLKYMLYKLIR